MIGPHVITRTDAALEWARRAPIVKVIGDQYVLRQARPGAITIFRAFFTQAEQDQFDVGMVLDRTFVQLDNFRPTYIELFNEHAVRLSERLADHVALVKAAIPRVHAYGSKVAAFSFPVGCPEPEDWWYLRDHNFGDADAIALHQYWAKQGFSDWTALRHRRVHEWLNGHHPQFIITECGRDAVVQEGGDKQPGWKLQGVSPEDYAAELRAYDAEISKDGYVIGATVFTAGPTHDWNNFSTDEISHLILNGQGGGNVGIDWTLGFRDYAIAHPEVGTPLESLQYDDHGNAWQHSNTGLLFWHHAENAIHFFKRPKA